jgi:hypothetical protein
MIKYAYRIIFIILLIVLIINVALFLSWSGSSYDDDVYVVNPQLKNMKVTTKLYFVYEGQLHNETRTIVVKNREFEESIFEELLIGPKTKAYSPILPDDVRVISFEVRENVIYINLGSKFIADDFYTEDTFYLHIMTFVNTLTELQHGLKVQFLIDGERINEEIHGISLMEPINRDERVNYQRNITSADVVVSFIEQIFNGRFDLAYEMMDDHSKSTYPFDVFRELMEGYIYYHVGYQRNIYFTQNYDLYDIVTVKFVETNPSDTNPREITEQWMVIKTGDDFKIDITEMIRP